MSCKVFCCNCKHYKFVDIAMEDLCKKNPVIKDDIVNGEYKVLHRCRGINKDLNCPFYERKWWKFWVKDNKQH